MYSTAQFKKSTGVLTVKQIIFALVLLIAFVGQVTPIPIVRDRYEYDNGDDRNPGEFPNPPL